MAVVVIAAEAINEGVREHDIGLALLLAAVAGGLVGVWRLIRWLELR